MWPGRAKRASAVSRPPSAPHRQVMRDDDCPIGMFPVATLRSSRTKRSEQVANGNCSEDKHSRATRRPRTLRPRPSGELDKLGA
jgi:hypothetical protein